MVRGYVAAVGLTLGGRPARTVGGPVVLHSAPPVNKARQLSLVLTGSLGLWCFTIVALSLLPIPPFANGELVFLCVEALRRRPLSARARAVPSALGLLLLALASYAFAGDLFRYSYLE